MTPRSSTAAPLAGATATILVVDDDSDVFTIAETLLADAGYEVMLAESGKVTLHIISITQPNVRRIAIGRPSERFSRLRAHRQVRK